MGLIPSFVPIMDCSILGPSDRLPFHSLFFISSLQTRWFMSRSRGCPCNSSRQYLLRALPRLVVPIATHPLTWLRRRERERKKTRPPVRKPSVDHPYQTGPMPIRTQRSFFPLALEPSNPHPSTSLESKAPPAVDPRPRSAPFLSCLLGTLAATSVSLSTTHGSSWSRLPADPTLNVPGRTGPRGRGASN